MFNNTNTEANMSSLENALGRQADLSSANDIVTAAERRVRATEVANEPLFRGALSAAKTRTYRAAVTAGLSTAEREDLFQEILLDIYERKDHFDPTRGGPGTFTGLVSAHRTAEFLSARKADRERLVFAAAEDIDTGAVVAIDRALHGLYVAQDAANDGDITSNRVVQTHDATLWSGDKDLFSDSGSLRDLETAMAYMSAEQTQLFQLLASHQDLPAAARASGIPSATFYRRVADLQMHLRMFGIRPAA
jgi:DNA-directed RNA polymerase specialized sigma24 family protein